jgi:hypothetical protein
MNPTWRHILRPLGHLGKGALILAVGVFVFQVLQAWCDQGDGIPRSEIRWIFPILAAVFSSSVLTLVFSLGFIERVGSSETESQVNLPPAEALANAIVEYGRQLHCDARDKAVVNLRNNMTLTLHVLGFYQQRIALGELALQSSVITGDSISRAQILVDDIGWAQFLQGDAVNAVQNITRGIDLARSCHSELATSGQTLLKFSLCEAKGLRHLALIQQDKTKQYLDSALALLQALDQSHPEVQRDIAQIYHAEALTIAARHRVQKIGSINMGDLEGLKDIDLALRHLRQSEAIFLRIEDKERYAKTLALEVRLLEAKRSDTEAKEVAALRDRALASSEWARPEGIKTLTGA